MAEPLSIASGVAGLVTLADVVIERIYKTIVACKNAGKDAQRLIREVQALLGILKSLHTLEMQVSNSSMFMTKIPPDQMLHCQKMLEGLRDKLHTNDRNAVTSKLEKTWRTLKWPFTASETDEILSHIERYKSTFDLTISMETLEALLAATPTLDRVVDDISEIKHSLYRMEMSNERQAIFNFFRTFDPETNFQQGRKSRQTGTGTWLIKSNELNTWLVERNSKLWLYGIPGAGKTVLAAAILEEAIRTASGSGGTIGLAFYFCDYRDSNKRKLPNVLASLAGQLARHNRRCFDLLQKCYNPGADGISRRELPETDDLVELVQKMAACFDDVMIVVDALDEALDADEISDTLQECVSAGSNNIKIALLSRDELGIRRHMNDFVHVSIRAQSSDLRLYVSSELEKRMKKRTLRIRSPSLKDEILQELITGADGMFRWVACQLDHLCELPSDAARRKALKTLPPTLDETYRRMFDRINLLPEINQRLVQRTLHWLIIAPTINVQELCEAISINDGDQSIDQEATPHVEDVLFLCSSLVRLSVIGDHVELAHFTVEEYLRSPTLKSDANLSKYHYDTAEAAQVASRTYLTCVNMGQFSYIPRTRDEMYKKQTSNPFYNFTSIMWKDIFKPEFSAQEQALERKLFALDKTRSFQAWVQMVAAQDERDNLSLSYWNLALRMSPLHFACILNRPELVQWLVSQGASVDEHCPSIGVPLQCALLGDKALMSDISLDDLWMFSYDSNGPGFWSHDTKEVIRTLFQSGATWDMTISVHGDMDGLPTLVLACLIGVDDVYAEFGAVADSRCLEYLSHLDEHVLWDIPLAELLAFVRVENLSGHDQRTVAELGLRAKKISPNMVDGLSTAKAGPDILALQTKLVMAACRDDDVESLKRSHLTYGLSLDGLQRDESFDDLSPFLVAAQHQSIKVLWYLVQQGVNRNQKCDQGRNAIHHCLRYGVTDRETLKLLLDTKVDFNSPDINGDSPLHICAGYSNAVCMELLLAYGADHSALNARCESILHDIAFFDQVAMYRLLKSSMHSAQFTREMLRKNDDGHSPVHVAATSGPAVFKQMVLDGICLCTRADDGRNVWHFAARASFTSLDSLRLVATLEEIPCVRSHDGSTVVHDLIEGLDSSQPYYHSSLLWLDEVFVYLEQRNVNFVASNVCQQTPIDILGEMLLECTIGQKEKRNGGIRTADEKALGSRMSGIFDIALKELLRVGLDPLTAPPGGRSCLENFLSAYHIGGLLMWETLEQLLLAVPTDKLLSYRHAGKPILLWATIKLPDDLCHHLLQRGADPDERDELHEFGMRHNSDAYSPLEAMCWGGNNIALIKLAIPRTRRLNEVSHDGRGLLHLAACAGDVEAVSFLLESGVDVNLEGAHLYRGYTALMFAARESAPLVVQELLNHGANPNRIDHLGDSALLCACVSGCVESIKLLAGITKTTTTHPVFSFDVGDSALLGLERSGRPRTTIYKQCGPLEVAAYYGHMKVLEILLSLGSFNDPERTSPLWVACYRGHLDIVHLLLNHGYSADTAEVKWGLTPLHAAVYRGNIAVVDKLLTTGCKIDSVDHAGRRPMFYAVTLGHVEIVEKLRQHSPRDSENTLETSTVTQARAVKVRGNLVRKMIKEGNMTSLQLLEEGGWNLDSQMECGRCTAIMIATRYSQVGICDYLISKGVSLDCQPCLQHAKMDEPVRMASRLPGRVPILRAMLLSPRFPTKYILSDYFCSYHGSLLHEATAWGNTEAISVLLERGAKPNSQNVILMTPLHCAAKNGSLQAAKMLLSAGASAYIYDDDCLTPLDVAMIYGHEPLVRVLNQDRDARLQVQRSLSSHDIAAAYEGQIEVVRYLQSKGENVQECYYGHRSVLTYLAYASPAATTFTLNAGFILDTKDVLWRCLDPQLSLRLQTYRKLLKLYERGKIVPDLNTRQNPDRPRVQTTPLTMGCARGYKDAVEELIVHGALINLEGSSEGTPLMTACTYGRLAIVKVLVWHGALLAYSKNGEVFSAVHIAQHYPKIVRWLLVERFTEHRPLAACSAEDQSTPSINTKVPKLNLDLVFAEDWEEYVKSKLMPPSKRRFICRLENGASSVDETFI